MGKIHIYCGDGKGKTTASVGLAVRALGSGYHIIFVQFLKGSDSGELEVFRSLDNVEIIRSEVPMKFTYLMNEEELEECKERNKQIFEQAISRELTDKTLLVLDEVIGTMENKLLSKEVVMEFLHSQPDCEVVMTGRGPSKEVIDIADYVTEMKKIKHPYDRGEMARKGIEY